MKGSMIHIGKPPLKKRPTSTSANNERESCNNSKRNLEPEVTEDDVVSVRDDGDGQGGEPVRYIIRKGKVRVQYNLFPF